MKWFWFCRIRTILVTDLNQNPAIIMVDRIEWVVKHVYTGRSEIRLKSGSSIFVTDSVWMVNELIRRS